MEKTTKRRKYDRSFKEEAVKLSYERSNLSAFCRELGIEYKALLRWRKEYEQFKGASFQGNGVARLSDEQREIKRLQKALSTKNLELEILKKALGIISTSDH